LTKNYVGGHFGWSSLLVDLYLLFVFARNEGISISWLTLIKIILILAFPEGLLKTFVFQHLFNFVHSNCVSFSFAINS
jgi:hypothetical protein